MLWIYDNVSSTVNRDTLATDPATARRVQPKQLYLQSLLPRRSVEEGTLDARSDQ